MLEEKLARHDANAQSPCKASVAQPFYLGTFVYNMLGYFSQKRHEIGEAALKS